MIDQPERLNSLSHHTLNPDRVKRYSTEGNAIHYEEDAALRAGFRAPIIGGGMGVHFLLSALRGLEIDEGLVLDIYFRRPIFWDDEFDVGINDERSAIALVRDGKVLTEAKIHKA